MRRQRGRSCCLKNLRHTFTLNSREFCIRLYKTRPFKQSSQLTAHTYAHEQMWIQAQSKNIRMVRNIDIDHGWVRGDSGLLERAISNLLNNAIKYSPEGNTIVMNISRSDAHICCCVEDEGYGIPEDELPLLFERFRRAHSNSGDDQQGIGLGLALVKATAERHGGHVEVHSTVGQGSRFCLILPETDLTL